MRDIAYNKMIKDCNDFFSEKLSNPDCESATFWEYISKHELFKDDEFHNLIKNNDKNLKYTVFEICYNIYTHDDLDKSILNGAVLNMPYLFADTPIQLVIMDYFLDDVFENKSLCDKYFANYFNQDENWKLYPIPKNELKSVKLVDRYISDENYLKYIDYLFEYIENQKFEIWMEEVKSHIDVRYNALLKPKSK